MSPPLSIISTHRLSSLGTLLPAPVPPPVFLGFPHEEFARSPGFPTPYRDPAT